MPSRSTRERPGTESGARARDIRVVFLWAEVSGYMPACWRAMAARRGVDVHVVHPRHLLARENPFDAGRLLGELSNDMFETNMPDLDRWLVKTIVERSPDVVVMCGWIFWPYTRVVTAPELRNTRVVLGMDSPWRGTWKQRLARLRLSDVVKRVDLAVTASEPSSEYARWLGVPESRIHRGFYGFDYDRFHSAPAARPSAWPRQFLFVGRYVPQKDLKTLVAAYTTYRQSVSEPWGLTCCGTGDDARLLNGVPGVVDARFTQPDDLPGVFSRHGAFVLPSRFEPWGVVLAEAAAAGLPIICTNVCGAGQDLVRPYFNGVVVAPQDVPSLARAMRWVHEHESELQRMGGRGQAMAEAFSAQAWASRWHNYLLDAIDNPRQRSQ